MELCGSRRKMGLLVLCIVYLSRYFNIIAAADVCSCKKYSCDTCPSTGSCSKINVALEKTANASSLYDNATYNEVSGPACLVVNGNIGTEFKPINKNLYNPACVHTADGDYTPYWEVDLEQQYIISSITVYGREENGRNMLRKATVSVDDKLCYTFPSEYPQPVKADISCNPPLTGRKVKIQKINDTDLPFLAVCQVQVWVCKSGFYGTDCTNTCGNCSADTCEPSSGVCPQGCVAGYQAPYCKDTCTNTTYGMDCNETCGNCAGNATCNVYNGSCETRCAAGYRPPLCKDVCNGSYGPNCIYACGYCTDGTTCNATSGECPHGCKGGYTGTYCNETCRNNTFGPGCNETCGHCVNDSQCDIYNGTCEAGCAVGYKPPFCTAVCNDSYGPDCKYTCGNCTDGTMCNPQSGECPHGCKAGYGGNFCNETCINNTFGPGCNETCGHCVNGSHCDIYNGTCEAGCAAGYKSPFCTAVCSGSYGPDCKYTCGNCTDGTMCNPQSGECPHGCKAGYGGNFCNETCRNNTFGPGCNETCGHCLNDSQCEIYDGTCEAGCAAGYKPPLCTAVCNGSYGPDCKYPCGNCAGGTMCNPKSGECPNGCHTGYGGKFCNETCRNNTFGPDCNKTCGHCVNDGQCDIYDGRCEAGCAAGYKPPVCIEKIVNTPVIAAVTVAVVVIIVLVVTSILVLRRRRTNSNKQGADNMAFTRENRAGGQDGAAKDTLSLTPMPSSTNLVGEGKADKEKPSVVVKPTVVKMSKGGAAGAKRVTPENVYNNLTQDVSPETQPNDRLILPELEDESDHMYRNVENTYATFLASRPQLDSVQQSLIDLVGSGNLPVHFQELPMGLTDVHEVAKLPVNIKKNRYHSILPYDVNRVVLSDSFSEGMATDFINASYITGFHQAKKYIATQAPRDNTVADFWRMVWQEQITQIVMLTGLVENGKEKCFEYWPARDNTATYGPVTVTGVDVQRKAHFFVRTFIVRMSESGKEREVEQLNFVTWPDHGVPTTTSLLNFWRFAKARAPHRPPPPVLVHCTAGVGRTGTYIGLDIAYEQVVSQGGVNLFEIVERMRRERCTMVQAPDQYIFLHKALLEAYTAGETTIANGRFDKFFPQPITALKENLHIDREFKRAMQMRSLTPGMPVTVASEDSNKTKIRNTMFLPADDHLVYLTAHVPGRNQFINAVYMPTYREYNGSILTQLPLEETLVDFWRLVDGCDVKTIVSLGHKNKQETVQDYCQFWPNSSRTSLPVDPYIIRHKVTSTLGNHLTSYTVSLEKKKVQESREVQLLHYKAWAGELPENTTDLLALIDKIDSLCLGENNPPPVIIQCQDGVTRSGLFVALWNVFSRLTSDKEVDVYMAVREVHRVRPQAVTSLEQYRYSYEVAQKRVTELNIYTNA